MLVVLFFIIIFCQSIVDNLFFCFSLCLYLFLHCQSFPSVLLRSHYSQADGLRSRFRTDSSISHQQLWQQRIDSIAFAAFPYVPLYIYGFVILFDPLEGCCSFLFLDVSYLLTRRIAIVSNAAIAIVPAHT